MATPYHTAIANNDLAEIRRLAQIGVDPNTRNEQGQTALDLAIEAAHLDDSAFYGPANETPDQELLRQQRTRAAFDRHVEMGVTLMHHGAEFDQADLERVCDLPFDDNRLAWTMLDAGADPNAQRDGYTALHTAAGHGNTDIVKILLAYDADPNICGQDIDAQLNEGLDLVEQTFEGGTRPLHQAVLSGSPETVSTLLDNGANLDLTSTHGDSAYDWAAPGGYMENEAIAAVMNDHMVEQELHRATAHIADDWNPSMGEEAPIQGDNERPDRQRSRF